MATNEQEENGDTNFNLDAALKHNEGNMDRLSDDEVSSPDERLEGVSMFCRTCLNPYSGEQKSGTIVLRCDKCGQTDTVLEEKAAKLNPAEWSGNLMMNRFLQVMKEQKDLCLNIVDPFFAEDDYKRLSLAISEYTFNMKAIAQHMYDIAAQATAAMSAARDNQANEAVIAPNEDEDSNDNAINENSNKETTCTDVENIPDVKIDNVDDKTINQSSENTDVNVAHDVTTSDSTTRDVSEMKNTEQDEAMEIETDKGTSRNPSDTEATEVIGVSEQIDSDIYRLPLITHRHIEGLGAAVVGLMKTLIEKYKLPLEIMDKVEEEIRNPSSRSTEENNPTETDTSNMTEENETAMNQERSNENETGNCSDTDDANTKNHEASESASPFAKADNDDTDNDEESEESSDEDEIAVYNLTKRQIREELNGALKSKFKFIINPCLYDDEVPNTTNATDASTYAYINEHSVGQTGSSTENETITENNDSEEKANNDTPNGNTNFKSIDGNEKGTDSASNVLNVPKDEMTNANENDMNKPETIDIDGNENETNDTEETENTQSEQAVAELIEDQPSGTQVNFYIVSTVFINELQGRKKKALMERKDKALKTIHEKIVNLKAEVAKVEDKVKDELTQAYEKKLKKVENQRKQLDMRHKQVEEAEALLDFYARTGQREKLAELMEQLNIQYEN